MLKAAELFSSANDFDDSLFFSIMVILAQSIGLYSGIVENAVYAAVDRNNERFYLDSLKKIVADCYEYNTWDDFLLIIKREFREKSLIRAFCRNHNKIFVYGAGAVASEIIPSIPQVDAVLVSDTKNNPQEFFGKRIVPFSYISYEKGMGIIVAVSGRFRNEIVEKLADSEFKDDYICIREEG